MLITSTVGPTLIPIWKFSKCSFQNNSRMPVAASFCFVGCWERLVG